MTAARAVRHAPLELRGRRVLLRSLTENDFVAWLGSCIIRARHFGSIHCSTKPRSLPVPGKLRYRTSLVLELHMYGNGVNQV